MEDLTEISLRERIRLNLVFAMERANINQVNLADKLGISKGTVNNWVRGNNSPDVDMVPKICKVLKISIKDFYSDSIATSYGAQDVKNAHPYSEEALMLAEDYTKRMDDRGRETVRGVADLEVARYKAAIQKKQEKMEAAAEITPEVVFVCPGFTSPMSAGTGQQAGEDYPENYHLIKEPPRGTSYIATVSGDSMEPKYHNGDKLFVHACSEIPIGKVGVFYMAGQQWVKILMENRLISINDDYGPIQITEDFRCQGLVLGVCDESYFK